MRNWEGAMPNETFLPRSDIAHSVFILPLCKPIRGSTTWGEARLAEQSIASAPVGTLYGCLAVLSRLSILSWLGGQTKRGGDFGVGGRLTDATKTGKKRV